jgi:nucleoside-diphosphate-sugar epimerase
MTGKYATQKALVMGATGYVGRQVVRRLCEEGVSTLAHVRPGSSKIDDWNEKFSEQGAVVLSTAWNSQALESALAKHAPTHVFALIGTTRSRAKGEQIPGDIYQSIDYGLTKMLLDGCQAQDPAPRFIYLSSVGASSKSRSAYLRARGQLEEDLESSGLSWISARPAAITGHDRDVDRPAERWGAAIGDRVLSLASLLGAKRLREEYESTSSTRLAEALVELGLSEETGVQSGAALRRS